MCNLPVVSIPVGDVLELLQYVEPSWIRDPAPEPLAEELVECLREPVRSNGREAAEWPGTETIARRILQLYANLEPAAIAGTSAGAEPCAA